MKRYPQAVARLNDVRMRRAGSLAMDGELIADAFYYIPAALEARDACFQRLDSSGRRVLDTVKQRDYQDSGSDPDSYANRLQREFCERPKGLLVHDRCGPHAE